MTPLTEATIEQLEAALEAKRAEVEEPDYEAWRPALEAYCNIRGGTVNTPLCEIDKLEIRSLIAALPLAPRQVEAPTAATDALIAELEANINLKADFIEVKINQLAEADAKSEATDARLREACEALEQCPKWLARLDGHEPGSTTDLLVDQINATLTRIRETIGE
jgi:hypothetical protein